jgi:hypothetical protein
MLLFGSVCLLLATMALQDPVNRVVIWGAEGEGCGLQLTNTEEMMDLRTDCALPEATQNHSTLLHFIKKNASYLIKEGRAVRGYRYFKDPLNYKFKEYDLQGYHRALQHTLEQLHLTSISLPF